MGKFQSYIQPNIIKVKDTLVSKGSYYFCWNISCWYGFVGLDIPRIYFNPEVPEDKMVAFYKKVREDFNHIKDGAGILEIGVDYWPSDAVRRALMKMDLPYMENYLLSDGTINPIYEEVEYDYYIKSDYYIKQNKIIALDFSEEDIRNFYSTFASYILEYTTISPSTSLDGNNQIYVRALEYLKEFKHDSTYISLVYILNSNYTTTNKNNAKCGCTNAASTSQTTQTCPEIYTAAMLEYIKSMFGDTDFIYDWLYTELPEGRIPNTELLNLLINFIQALIDSGYSLDFSEKKKSYYCTCPKSDSSSHDANIEILENYIQVLTWAKSCKIDENKNKIKSYGQAFGELIPNLEF